MNNPLYISIDVHEKIYSISSEDCADLYRGNKSRIEGVSYCESIWDSTLCWPPVQAGYRAWISCAEVMKHVNQPELSNLVLPTGSKAYRICTNESQWLWGNWTNYEECLNFEFPRVPLTVSLILLICSLISLIFLGITTFIFFYFKSLQCARLRVHRNLVVALMLHSLMLVIISYPVVGGPKLPVTGDMGWLCKVVVAIKMYAAQSSINWMFVEGMLLHSRITTSIFRKDAPFRLFYIIGWGIPLILTISWCICMDITLHDECWKGFGKSPYIWIITGPMISALGVNLIFLINVIRILVTKMKRSSTFEIVQIRRAMKATALLFPLLGIPHLLFCVNPGDESKKLKEAYMITNAVLQSSQGIFVSVLYCFINVEVRTALHKAYVRAALRRNPNHRYTWKCRTTRASQTSTSNCDTSATVMTDSRSVYLKNKPHGGIGRKSTTRRHDLSEMAVSSV